MISFYGLGLLLHLLLSDLNDFSNETGQVTGERAHARFKLVQLVLQLTHFPDKLVFDVLLDKLLVVDSPKLWNVSEEER